MEVKNTSPILSKRWKMGAEDGVIAVSGLRPEKGKRLVQKVFAQPDRD